MYKRHNEISDKIAQNNATHDLRVDVRNRLKTFNVGDIVLKLHACSSDLFQILMKLNYNIYVIDLFIDFGISFTSILTA